MWNRIGVLACCAMAQWALAQPAWTFQSLGTFGGNASWASAVNNAGDVVGWAGVRKGEFTDIDPEFHAFVLSGGTMRDLGAPGSNSAARAISDSGEIVGTAPTGAVSWHRGVMTPLPFKATPNRVNRMSAVVGTHDSAAGDFRGFVYRNGAMTELGTLGGTWSTAVAVNDRGVIVGSSATASGAVRGYVRQDGRMREIGTFGGPVSQAHDVNERGVVVGSAGNASGGVEAFIDDGAMRPLFPAASPYDVSEAFAINSHGQVVGILNDAGFLWDGGKLTMLRDLLTPEQRVQWGVLTPADINDRGWIVGVASTEGVNGVPGGLRRGFILKPADTNGDGGRRQTR